MSLFANPIALRSQNQSSNLTQPASWLLNLFGGESTASGSRVSNETAMRVVAVYACVRLLAESLGSLPAVVYRRRPDGGKDPAPEHPLYQLLHNSPNPEMTAIEWQECGEGHHSLRGASYSQIVWSARGRPSEIVPLHPDRMHLFRDEVTDALVYRYTDRHGRQTDFRPEEVLHVRGLTTDGIHALSPIGQAREAVGLAQATEEHGARFFSNSATPSGVLHIPTALSDEAYDRLKKGFADDWTGNVNARKPMLLEEGLQWQQMGMKASDAQFLENRKFQVAEIARLFRVPLHMIGELDRSTNNNIEHQGLEFVKFTMLPRIRRWEARINKQLFLPRADREYFVEFNFEGLLRGDIKTRFEAYKSAIADGWLNPNEVRAKENLNPIPGGEKYRVQSGFLPLEDLGKNLTAPAPAATSQASLAIRHLRPALRDAAGRALRREAKALEKLHKRGLPPPDVANLYAEQREHLCLALGPIFAGYVEGTACDPTAALRALADEFCGENRRLAEAMPAADFEAFSHSLTTDRIDDLANRALDTMAALNLAPAAS